MYAIDDFTDVYYDSQNCADQYERRACFAIDALVFEDSDCTYTDDLFDDDPDWTEQNIMESTDPETGEFDWDKYAALCEIF